VPSRRASQWQYEPTSTPSQPDTVPSKSLPPLSSLDRMVNGERLGQCPTCGGHRWWDNRSRKATGEMKRSQPDYVCADCRHGRWNDGRHELGRPTGRRSPEVRVTALPADHDDSAGGRADRMCAASKRDGTACRNVAMAGSRYCGPHSDVRGGSTKPAVNQCRGTTKAGRPCRAGAVRGSEYCPQHEPGG
jgi:hypothetical protein